MKYEVKLKGERRETHSYFAFVEVEAGSEREAREKADELFLEDDSRWVEAGPEYSSGCIEVSDVEVTATIDET